jgi:hypothetical protein
VHITAVFTSEASFLAHLKLLLAPEISAAYEQGSFPLSKELQFVHLAVANVQE